MDKQTGDKRQRTAKGQFTKGNTEGNRWRPGESGHPGPKPSIIRAFKRLLSEDPSKLPALAEALYIHSLNGSPQHIKLAIEYLDGKVPDVLRVEEHRINVQQPGIATGPYEVDDGDDDDADDQPTEPDP